MRHLRFYVVALLLVLSADSIAFGQWSITARSLAKGSSSRAMCYMDGVLWIAADQLSISKDLGLTWQTYNWPGVPAPQSWFDIQFFDKNHGVASGITSTCKTSNGGLTWSLLSGDGATSVCFGRTFNQIGVCFRSSTSAVTTDAGLTWNNAPGGGFPFCIRRMRDGSITSLHGSATGSHLYNTTNGGTTWSASSGFVDWDSFAFAQDSCDAARFYVSNEDLVAPTDDFSSIFVTSNAGATWRRTKDGPLAFFTGSLAVSSHAVYCPTTKDGIYRSTDRGLTWKNIGGPIVSGDTRLIAAIDDNTIIAVDDDGNVWRTTNSGGDSIRSTLDPISLSKNVVDFLDTTYVCEQALDTLFIGTTCNSATIASILLTGADSAGFRLTRSSDTIRVTFAPDHAGPFTANVRFVISTGDTITIARIQGSARSIGWTTISSRNASTDTVGGEVWLPIIVHDRGSSGALSFRLSYDTTNLVYLGTYDDSTALTDRTVGVAATSASITFPNLTATGDSVIGYVKFSVFPHRTQCTSIAVDSLYFTSRSNSSCLFSVTQYSADICWTASCGSAELSDMVRYRTLPRLTISPNPARNIIELSASTVIDGAVINISDAAGHIEFEGSISVGPGSKTSMDVRQLPRGPHFVRIDNGAFRASTRFVIE
jgi:hypothetical protein